MTLQVNTAPLSRELISTLPPVSDTDIFEKYVVPGMAADEQLVGGQVVDRTQADPKGKWRLYGYDPRTDPNPFDVMAQNGQVEIDSHYCTALVKKGSTTLYKGNYIY